MTDPISGAYSPELRKVPLELLRPGMFIQDLQVPWLSHPFFRKRFVIRDQRMIERLRQEGIREVVIDVKQGLDVDPAMLPNVYDEDRKRFATLDQRFREVTARRTERFRGTVTLDEERNRLQYFQQEAMQTVQSLTENIRSGQQIDLAGAEPTIEKMIRSVQRHPDALIPMLRMKDTVGYDHQHSLSVASMAVALGQTLGVDEANLRQLAFGALLQDVGKARIPDDILQKPDRLTAYETRWIRRHVFESQLILEDTPGMTEMMLDIVAHHHERLDGTGYPHALSGAQIPLHAQVAAIVDVYDALTSDRPFQQRTEPTEALRQLYGMTSHFSEDLIKAFVRTVGVYPVGSLVRLDNGYLAVVVEENRDDLLKPRVCVMFDTRIDRYIRPYLLDLGHRLEPPIIVGFESYARWAIDPRRWHPR
jgi:HD-GYP domain-containing protein (c-di-GMP phosphodiesterase class II)